MGWKWNDVAALLRELGMFSEEQIAAVTKVVNGKKRELADKLAELASAEAVEAKGAANHASQRWHQGREDAFLEAREAVKP